MASISSKQYFQLFFSRFDKFPAGFDYAHLPGTVASSCWKVSASLIVSLTAAQFFLLLLERETFGKKLETTKFSTCD